MTLDKKNLREYNATRGLFHRKYLCYAPFSNMYFNIHGDAAPCWLGFIKPDNYPKKNIKDIWLGAHFQKYRNNIIKKDLNETCAVCLSNLKNKNYTSVLAKAYDGMGKPTKFPSMMELELDNTCQLECIMCNGFLSSEIRKNRDKAPKLKVPYDNAFVNQLEDFIPHLKEIRFNGGEPFLSPMFFDICDIIFKKNKKLKIVVATNGLVYNPKVREYIEKGRFNLNISIDSLQKDTYESIRINGRFAKLMENFEIFYEYCKRKKTKLCIMVNPMRQNWQEMPDFVNFCNKMKIDLWFNTVRQPKTCAIWPLPADKLQFIYDTLSKIEFNLSSSNSQATHNINLFKNLVNVQLFSWLMNAKTSKENQGWEAEMFKKRIVEFLKEKHIDANKTKLEFEKISVVVSELLSILKENGFEECEFYNMSKNLSVEMICDELIKANATEIYLKIKNML